MRILVIGGTGFIGPWVVQRLAALGHELVLFHRGQTPAGPRAGVRHILGDRRRLEAWAGELQQFAPEVVIDMIPAVEQDARSVMAAFRGVAGRVVALSSQDVYRAYGRMAGTEPGPVEPVPLAEDAPLREKRYPYRGEVPREADDPGRYLDDYDKIGVEQVVLGNPELPGTVLRLPMVYGPGDRQHRLFEYLKRMRDGRPVIILDQGLARWRWTRGYVEDVASAVVLVVQDGRAAGRIYNLGEPEALPEAEWARAVGRAAGWEGEVTAVPRDRLPAQWRPQFNTDQDLVVDTARIRQELGYAESVTRDEALRRTIAWEQAHPPASTDPQQFDYAAEDRLLRAMGGEEERQGGSDSC